MKSFRQAGRDSPAFAARKSAWRVLDACRQQAPEKAVPVQALLSREVERARLSPLDAALCTELVYGVLRQEGSLAALLARLIRRKDGLPPSLLHLIELAAYELLYLDRIPAHASVHTAVSLARSRFGQGLASLSNGVLRSLLRWREQTPDLSDFLDEVSGEEKDFLRKMESRWSVPAWIISLWRQAWGEERARELAQASGQVPWTCVRLNASRPDWRQLRDTLMAPSMSRDASPGTSPEKALVENFARYGLRFAPGTAPADLRDYAAEGRLSFQGSASQEVLSRLFPNEAPDGDCGEPRPAETTSFWDACAGRGGKCFALMERGFKAQAVSDLHLSRLRGLRREAERLALPLPPLFCASATAPPFAASRHFDSIVLDAPCSGLGTLARRPDLRRLRLPDHLPPLVKLQKDMLDACWARLAPGGRLAYLTCTVNPAENEGQIEGFLRRHPEAEILCRHETQPGKGADLMFGSLLLKPRR